MKINLVVASLAALGLSISASSAQTFYSADFETDTSANWNVNVLGTGSDANFLFDYSTVGVPSAPNSGGTTSGLRLRANMFGSTLTFPGGVSVSPTGLNLTGDYILRYDSWQNFPGPAPGGGAGSTQLSGAGIGTAGTSAQIAGGAFDSITFVATGEGGSTVDYRAYVPAGQTGLLPSTGVYAAGTQSTARNNTDPYYAGFGGELAPAAQIALFPGQTGTTAAGTLGWAWRDVMISKEGNTVTWTVDGLLLATVDTTTAGTLGGGNILLSHFDFNSTQGDATSVDTLFGLFDNVRVTAVPEPTTAAFALLGALGLLAAYRRNR